MPWAGLESAADTCSGGGGQEVATYSREKPLENLLLASLSCKPDSGLGHFLNVLVGLQP